MTEELDSYLTGKIQPVIVGALVYKLPHEGQRYVYVLRRPGEEDVILGYWFDSARRALKQLRQHILAAQYMERNKEDYK